MSALGASISEPDYRIDIWEVEQGLPQHTTTSMVQTPDGYLWIGTFGGLVRWDGVKFTVFTERNTPSLGSSSIVSLHLDGSQRLWVSTRDGLVVSRAPNWTRFTKMPGWTGDMVRSVAESNGVICLTSFNGKVFLYQTNTLAEMPRPPGRDSQGYLCHFDRTGRLWLAQNGFFGWWNGEQWETSRNIGLITNSFKGIATARDGSLVTVANREVLWMDGDEVRTRLPIPEDIPYWWNIWEASDGKLWVATVEQGLYCIDRQGGVRRYTTANGLTYDSMRFTFEDRESNLWVGTSGGGLMRFKPRTFSSFGSENGLMNQNVKAVIERSPGEMMFGTFGGPLQLIRSNQVSTLDVDMDGDGTPGHFIQCLKVDSRHNVWVGTYGRGLRMLSNSVGRIFNSTLTGGSSVYALYEDAAGRIWIGGEDAVTMYDGNTFHRHAPANLRLGVVRWFAEESKQGALWALTTRGLFRHEREEWREVMRDGKPVARGSCLHVDSEGNLWVGVSGIGLLRRRLDGSWSDVTEAHGLPKGNINSFQQDDLGYWWLGSDRGVIRAARSDLERVANRTLDRLPCQVFTSSDGLANIECANGFQSVSARDDQGRLWFATPKGLSMVDPAQLRLNTNLPPVLVESIAYVDRAGSRQERQLTSADAALRIPAGSRELEVHFTALSYTAPEKIHFAYQIEGEGNEWVDADTRRTLYFHSLKPGPLRLNIRAANDQGVWNERHTTLALTIEAFTWQTLWFRVLLIGSIMTTGIVTAWRLAQNKVRRHIEKLEHERALERERARLAAVMEGTSDFVGFCDPAGNISYVNSAGRRMVGWADDEPVTGRKITDFHQPDITKAVVEKALPIARRDGVWSGETPFLHRDGREIPTSQVIIAHKDSAGRLQFYSTIARDITEQRQAQNEIRQLNSDLEHRVEVRTTELRTITKDLEAFSYSVAHDLRAPLQNISGYAGLLRSSAGTLNPVSSGYLEIISTQVKRMATLIEDLLSFARVTRAELRKVPVNLDEMIRQTREAMAMEQQKRNITWNIEPLPPVLADRGLLRQVIANLISNAIKYSRERNPAVIQIGTLPQANGEVVIFVRDNGAGFDMKHADKLFEAFHRLHSPEEFEGNGIGLANVQRIIQRHGGRVWAEAELNKGATFYFSLPA